MRCSGLGWVCGSWVGPLKTTSANNKFNAPNEKKLVPGLLVGNQVESVTERLVWGSKGSSSRGYRIRIHILNIYIRAKNCMYILYIFFFFLNSLQHFWANFTVGVLIKLLYIQWSKCVCVCVCVCGALAILSLTYAFLPTADCLNL